MQPSNTIFLIPAVGEPPMCLGYGVVMALRQAITAARALAGNTDWFDISKLITFFITSLLHQSLHNCASSHNF